MFTTLIIRLHNRQAEVLARRAELDPETGASTVEVLSWAAVSVVAIVTIGGALKLLGVDVINYVRTQIGV